MRKRTLLIGVVLLLFGIYMIYGGTGIVNALATSTAIPSVKEDSQEWVLTVDGSNYSYISTPLSVNNLHSLNIAYTANGDVSFYVMDQAEFDVWKSGQPSQVELKVFSAKNGNFTLNPNQSGTYYYVFDNRESNTVKSVGFTLSKEVVVTETSPFIPYLPFGFIIVGLVLTGLALSGGRRNPAKDRATLERIATNLGIDPEGLKDKELRERIRKEVATKVH
jgi:hypothetical protein